MNWQSRLRPRSSPTTRGRSGDRCQLYTALFSSQAGTLDRHAEGILGDDFHADQVFDRPPRRSWPDKRSRPMITTPSGSRSPAATPTLPITFLKSPSVFFFFVDSNGAIKQSQQKQPVLPQSVPSKSQQTPSASQQGMSPQGQSQSQKPARNCLARRVQPPNQLRRGRGRSSECKR